MKKVLIITLFIISIFLGGCNFFTPEPKEFSKDGITLTLDESFKENENDLHKVTFASTKALFTGNYETLSSNLSVKEYATLCLKAIDSSEEVLEYTDDNTTFAYSYYVNTVEDVFLGKDVTYKYMLVCMKGSNNKYYCMNFGTTENNFDDYKDQMFEWAKTIKVE